jgi:hypothetical protein
MVYNAFSPFIKINVSSKSFSSKSIYVLLLSLYLIDDKVLDRPGKRTA